MRGYRELGIPRPIYGWADLEHDLLTFKPERVPPPGRADKLRRLCWLAAWSVLYRPSPVPMHGWRRFLLRCFGARVGAGAHPYPSARIWAPWNLMLHHGACLGPDCDIYNVAPVELGSNAVVSQKAYLCTASHDIRRPGFALTAAPIAVREGAWVAASAFIGPGVTIAEGAVVGACGVVTRDVGRGQVVAGNPARRVGTTGLLDQIAPDCPVERKAAGWR